MRYTLTLLLAMTFALAAQASDNIDLSTVPARKTVQLTIYNSADLTLVRETRQIVFKKGVNALQFSWANTLIDPTSVQVRFLDHPDQLTVLDTTFPHDKPQMLYWNIQSDFAGPATVEISYFTSGISWAADYVAIANRDETTMKIDGYVTVTNRSGEDYEDAQVRLVVGKINLVESIADLARREVLQQAELMKQTRKAMRQEIGKAEFHARSAAGGVAMDAIAEEKAVGKEGLSEYFIFTIEGTETIPDQWAKRMRSFHTDKAAVKVQYRYRPREYGDQLVKMFLMTNDKPAGMGDAPLPDGVFRVFQDSGHDGLQFLTQQSLQYVPAGGKIELNLGANPNVVFQRIMRQAYRDQLLMRFKNAELLFNPNGGMRIDPQSDLVGWQENTVYVQAIHNDTDTPIEVEVRQPVGGDSTFTSDFAARAFDANTVEFTTTLKPAEHKALRYRVTQRQGRLYKQDRVTVEHGDIPPVQFVRQ